MTKKELENIMINDEYRGKPYVLLIAVVLGFICMVIAGVFFIVYLVDLIMWLIEKL